MTSTLFTPSLSIDTKNTNGYTVDLNVVNVSSTPRTGTLEIIRFDGVVLKSGTYTALPAGDGTGIQAVSFIPANSAVTLFYGRATVDDSTESVRVNLMLIDKFGDSLVSVEGS